MPLILYIITLLTLSAFDSIWLFSMGANYRRWLSHLFAPEFSFAPAVVFYLLYAVGLVYFVITPSISNNTSYLQTFAIGAFLGLLSYAAYDLTNQATLENWPLIVTLVDMAWGILLSGLVSVVVKVIYTTFVK